MRIQLIPGARILWIVQMKLIAPRSDEIATRCRERIQRSWPLPGEKNFSETGGWLYQPDFAAPPFARKLMNMTMPPKRKNQYDAPYSRGKAMSRAPNKDGKRKFPLAT